MPGKCWYPDLVFCPHCGGQHPDEVSVCPATGEAIPNGEGPAALVIGELLDEKYHIVREIGRGAMGVVYEAVQVALRRRVAVKTLLEQTSAEGQLGARFEREARAASAIGHPNIIEVFDLGRTREGLLYMVMQLLDGAPLTALLKETPQLPIPLATHIMAQVLSGLSAAHRNGIVHRDLKPDNIFILDSIEQPNFAKIVDFGISKIIGRDTHRPGSRFAKTLTGSVLGTPLYMSPEQALGQIETIDHRTDIYSAGVVFYEMLCGRPPFQGEGVPQVLAGILDGNFPSPRSVRPEIPLVLEAAIVRALARDPQNRFASATAMRAEITGGGETTPTPVKMAVSSSAPVLRALDTFRDTGDTASASAQLENGNAAQIPEMSPSAYGISDQFAPPPESNLALVLERTASPQLDEREAAPFKPHVAVRARRPASDQGRSSAAPARRPRGFPWLRVVVGVALLIVGATFVVRAVRQRAASRKHPPHEVIQKFHLRVYPAGAAVKIDHLPASARVLPLDSGKPRAHLLHVAAPGHVTRTFSFIATPGMELVVRLGRTLPAPSPTDPPPLPAELDASYPETPQPAAEIDQAFGWLGRYADCLDLTDEVGAAARKSGGQDFAEGGDFAPCRGLLDGTPPKGVEFVALHAAALAYVSAAQTGKKTEALARLATRFRAVFLAVRAIWQQQELSRLGADEGRKAAWHMRRVALAAQAWVRARKVGRSEARARQLEAYTDELSTYVHRAKQSLGVVRGTEDFLRVAQAMAALVHSAGGRRVSDAVAYETCGKLLTEFDALVLE